MAVIGVWTSLNAHSYGPASCHPGCKLDQGDMHGWQETYPASLNLENFRLDCMGIDNSCAFMDNISVTNDPVQKIITVRFRHRSGPLTVRAQADIID